MKKTNILQNKKRVGLLLPSVQIVTEPLFYKLAGDMWDFHTQRVRLLGGDVDDLVEMEKHVPESAAALSDANVDVIAYCCAGSGAILGRDNESALCKKIEDTYGIPMISSMECCLLALQNTGAKTVTLIGPNAPEIAQNEVDYLNDNMVSVSSHFGFGIVDGKLFPEVDPEEIKSKAEENMKEDTDAMFLACMNWHATEILPALADRLQKPVVTSHSAVLWKIYCSVEQNISYLDFVRLLRKKFQKGGV